MAEVNRKVLLVSRPTGAASVENFQLTLAPLAPLREGEVRVRNHYLSLDPYMRGRMDDAKSYAPPQPLGAVMQGGTVGLVVESRHESWQEGEAVLSQFGWQEYGTSTGGEGLHRLGRVDAPISAYLGPIGMPGVTAWYGMKRICRPKTGETVIVSAASGAVGSVAGQLARRQGARVVGIAGGAEKCAYAVEALGFAACVDYKAGNLGARLAEAMPEGAEAYFDNVGGGILDAALERMKPHGRIAVCGAISGYDSGPLTMANPGLILRSRLMLQGFIVTEHQDDWPEALAELSTLVSRGQLLYRETVAEGLENAPEAFLGMLKGRNFGKQLVKLI